MGHDLRFTEILGLSPVRERAKQAAIALRGAEDVPPSQWGLSSLKLLRPRLAAPLWLGRQSVPGQVILTNLFNHTQTPVEAGWSVKRTQVRDFRGRDLTYDSHNGTDLSIPVGTPVLTAAPGVVARVVAEFNRGGLKVFIDHGHGLMTTYAHLARALVKEGDVLARGQAIALSGYSGLDGAITFPWGVPHVHFNTWLNGEPVCPFGLDGQASLWLDRDPKPVTPGARDPGFTPTAWDHAAVDATIAACRTPAVRQRLQAIDNADRRARHLLTEVNYYPTRFPERPALYRASHPRQGLMDLPFGADRFEGAVFVDEL
ncbi:MAG: M23 family metallopeptidase [Myxococcales bacterium]|nr:M23 family metallopeptidase [Myxococcales bacterium]MCB9524755.1 M23 family metallopeptidase [Myxococcales bacterium]